MTLLNNKILNNKIEIFLKKSMHKNFGKSITKMSMIQKINGKKLQKKIKEDILIEFIDNKQ